MRNVLASLVLLAGCGSSDAGDPSPTSDPSRHPAWLAVGWDHDEGRSGFADYADYAIDLDPSGSYVWQYAVDELDGSWSLDGTVLRFDGTTQDFAVGKSCRVMTLSGKTYLSRAATAADCPTTAAPLTSLEKCLVGTFSASTPNGGTTFYRFDADRTMVEFYDDPGYTSGGDSYTKYGEFEMSANGDVTMVQPDGSSEVRASASGLLQMTREDPVANGCDRAQFDGLGGGGSGSGSSCSLTCSSDRVCSDYQGNEACCDASFPFYCPDTFGCFATAADRDAACATAYYGDPQYGCESGQQSIFINGITGHYCAPSCSGDGSFCPADVGGQQGACLIHLNGNATADACVLTCTDPGVTGGSCPGGMTCGTSTNGGHYCVWSQS